MTKNRSFVFVALACTGFFITEKATGQDTINSWSLGGNTNANINSKFGTINTVDLKFITSNEERMRIARDGNVYIGKNLTALGKTFLKEEVVMGKDLNVLGNIFFAGSLRLGTTRSNSCSVLDISSNNKGVLLPRMTMVQRNAIESPALGLLVYQTDSIPGFYCYNEGWRPLTSDLTSSPNLSLSNLSSTAINNHLLPNLTSDKDLGSIDKKWRNIYLSSSLNSDTVKTAYLNTNILTVAGGGIRVTDASKGVEATGTYGVYAEGLFMGLYGSSRGYYGIYGSSASGIGIYGSSDSYYGISGYSFSNSGIRGDSYYGVGGNFLSTYNNGIQATTKFGAYAGLFEGDILVTNTYSTSDKNLKKNVKELDNALSIINKLRPRNYQFRNDGKYADMNLPKGNHFGLIAQEVEEVLPSLVKESAYGITKLRSQEKGKLPDDPAKRVEANEKIQVKAVNYTELIPIVIKGMQELNEAKDKQIEDLQRQINELKDAIKEIVKSNGPANLTPVPSKAYLSQNFPNPFASNTTISYYVPTTAKNAHITLTDINGRVLKTFTATKGDGQISIRNKEFSSGTYQYSLVVDGLQIATRQLVISR